MQQKIIQVQSVKRNPINAIGIVFLPNDPFLIKDQPFYLKRLCGMSILERNISSLKKIGIKHIFIFANNSENLKIDINIDKSTVKEILKVKSLVSIKEYLNQGNIFNSQLNYAIIIDGGALIDDRIISSLLDYKEEVVYAKGSEIHSNYNDRSKILACKINIKDNDHLLQKDVCNFDDFFNSLSLNKKIYSSTDEISTYKPDMRRNLPLYALSIRTYEDFKSVKKILVKRTQKGTLDLIAWYFNRYFENVFVYLLADTRITANHITILVNIFGYIVLILFLLQYWWLGLILLIFINIFDGVDGKLARLRKKESKVGHIEHSFDQLYEQAIYTGVGLSAFFMTGHFYVVIILVIMLLADSFNRHCSMQYKEVMGITLADSSRFDQLFRKFDGRRNIYTLHILIFGILGHFEYAIFSICIHAIITSIVYSIQAIKHMKKVDDSKF